MTKESASRRRLGNYSERALRRVLHTECWLERAVGPGPSCRRNERLGVPSSYRNSDIKLEAATDVLTADQLMRTGKKV